MVVLGGGALIAAHQLYPTYSTEVGGQRLALLEDGSRVRLNTDSKVQVHFTRTERRVKLLRGEAFFEVAHNAARPFTVDTGEAHVRALGTKFDVRRDGDATQVTLLEGRVQIGQAGRPSTATLVPNQALTVTATGITAPRPSNAVEASSWTSGRLTFRGVPLKAAVQEINRYSAKKVVLAVSGAVGDEPVSGQFETGDTRAFVQAVATVFNLHASDAGGDIRLAPSPPPG
jgi:transmembrane sensor